MALLTRLFLQPTLLGSALFNGFDTDCVEEVSLGQFLAGVAVLLKGSRAQREEFMYWCLCLDSDARCDMCGSSGSALCIDVELDAWNGTCAGI